MLACVTACAQTCCCSKLATSFTGSEHASLHPRRVQWLCAAATHLCLKLHLRRLKRVVWREVDINKEHAACIRAVARAHDCRLRAGAANRRCHTLAPLLQPSTRGREQAASSLPPGKEDSETDRQQETQPSINTPSPRRRGRTCQWNRSSPAGPALHDVGGSFCKSWTRGSGSWEHRQSRSSLNMSQATIVAKSGQHCPHNC